MKRFFIGLVAACVMLLTFGLMACGSTKAKVSGIYASVVVSEADAYSDTLADGRTIVENAYALQVGEVYELTVMYTASGGSQYPVLRIDGITLRYDSETFEISPPTGDYMTVARYQLTCKRAVDYSAIIFEVDDYSYSVIVSAV